MKFSTIFIDGSEDAYCYFEKYNSPLEYIFEFYNSDYFYFG
jgi:hypothetical protein